MMRGISAVSRRAFRSTTLLHGRLFRIAHVAVEEINFEDGDKAAKEFSF